MASPCVFSFLIWLQGRKMAEKETPKHETIESVSTSTHHHIADFESPTKHTNESAQADHIDLTWRSWLVVLISCFAIMAQVFVVVAAGSVIAFIIRELGEAPLAGWVIQVRPWMSSYTAFSWSWH